MLKKILCIFIATALLFLCACSKDTGEGKHIVFPIDESLSYLDPQIVTGASGRLAVKNCFEGLVRVGENGDILPAAAKSWDISPDGTVYTFLLREDAVWYIPKAVTLYTQQEGGSETQQAGNPTLPVTADDFVYAFRRAVSPATGSAYAQSLSPIENAESIIRGNKSPSELSVRSKGKNKLIIRLVSPDDDFLSVLASPVAMPCNESFFKKTGGRYGISPEYLIYNGPFYISSWVTDGSATLKPNEAYTGSFAAKPSSVYLSLNTEIDTRLEKLTDGTYDIAPLTAEYAQEAQTLKKVDLLSFKNGIKGLLFNCSDEYLSCPSLRRALMLSLKAAQTDETAGIVPDACIAAVQNYRSICGPLQMPAYKEKKARNEWKTALEQLETESVSISVLCAQQDETDIRRIMQNWQALFGISLDVKCEAVQPDELERKVENGSYQLALSTVTTRSEYASDFLMRFTTDAAGNTARLKDAEYDALMTRTLKAAGTKSMISALKEAEQYLLNNAVVIPFEDVESFYGESTSVSHAFFGATGELIDFSQTVKFD